MQDRWALMSGDGEWARDSANKVQTFLSEEEARLHLAQVLERDGEGGWTLEPFTVEDALEEAGRSPFASEGGL
ncbi:MAG: hypothetical protein ACRDIE_03405 [Chloroflexota bacterium]